MLNGPALWDLILGDMPEGAIIAGGAVRDYLLGVEPKDIDVFYATPAPDCDPRVGLHRIDNIYDREEEYKALTNINVISSGEMYGFKVDAIELQEMGEGLELVSGFDFAINQCWYEEGELLTTLLCREDLDNKTVTLMMDDRRERSLARFARFNERHAGAYTFVELI